MKKTYLVTRKNKVNRYFTDNHKRAKKLKYARLNSFWGIFKNEENKELFGGKKYSLLDEVIYKTVNTGVYHCKANTIKLKCGVGKNTLADFNNNLRSTRQFIVARYSTRRCNCNGLIYIDTQHADFYATMEFLFGMNEIDADFYLADLETAIDVTSPLRLDQSADDSIHRNKQDKIIQMYAQNELTKEFYEHVLISPAANSVKRYACKLALRIDKHASIKNFKKAVKTYHQLMRDVIMGRVKLTEESDIVRVFSGAYERKMNYPEVASAPFDKEFKKPLEKSPLYNWLEER